MLNLITLGSLGYILYIISLISLIISVIYYILSFGLPRKLEKKVICWLIRYRAINFLFLKMLAVSRWFSNLSNKDAKDISIISASHFGLFLFLRANIVFFFISSNIFIHTFTIFLYFLFFFNSIFRLAI